MLQYFEKEKCHEAGNLDKDKFVSHLQSDVGKNSEVKSGPLDFA